MSTNAAVVINEIAWMGGTASANHEWIELYNDGSAVDVSDWTITDGMNFNVTLSGTIPASSYVVLERSSEASAPGTAFLIYTGALVNTGATMQLKRSDGGLEDQVAGGENWSSIGGDNVTKETAQYTSAGWVTGSPTPGESNKGNTKPVVNDGDNSDVPHQGSGTSSLRPKTTSGETVKLELPGVTLKVTVDAQKVGYVNQPIEFTPAATGVGKTIVDSLVYQWNFGDGTTAFVKEPIHSFAYPGTYVVTAYASYKRQEQLARHEITILPVSLSLTRSVDGSIQVNNDSPYEIDISGYTLAAEKQFVFPKYSVLLPNQTITLSRDKIGEGVAVIKDTAEVAVIASKKLVVAETPTVPTASLKESAAGVSAPSVEQTVTAWHTPMVVPLGNEETLLGAIKKYLSPDMATANEVTSLSSSSLPKPRAVPESAWPYLGLIGVIIMGLFGTAKKVLGNQSE